MTEKKSDQPDLKRKLFDAEMQAAALTLRHTLQLIELGQFSKENLQNLYNTVASIKAGAMLAGLKLAAHLAETMMSMFEGFISGVIVPDSSRIDAALDGVELLLTISSAGMEATELDAGLSAKTAAYANELSSLLPEVTTVTAITSSPEPAQQQNTKHTTADDTGVQVNSMRQLFQQELKERLDVLAQNLLAVEQGDTTPKRLEELMRTAHTIKGGARLCNLDAAMQLAHVMEDIFVAAQKDQVNLESAHIDLMLAAADMFMQLSNAGMLGEPGAELEAQVFEMSTTLGTILTGEFQPQRVTNDINDQELDIDSSGLPESSIAEQTSAFSGMLRISSEHMDQIIGLAGELNVEAKQFELLRNKFSRIRRHSKEIALALANTMQLINDYAPNQHDVDEFEILVRKAVDLELDVSEGIEVLDGHDLRSSTLTRKMFNSVLSHRMRPFSEGVQGFHRLSHKIGRSLGKELKLEIVGEDVQVDRDILEKLNAPLIHLLQNAIDHGLELPEEREQSGKPAVALVRLKAQHKGGMLVVTVEDDGKGIDVEHLRRAIVERRFATESMAAGMSDAELLEFLFLPSFTLKDDVTTLSGRGVGLDIVREMLREVRGTVHVITQPGKGTSFELSLPITLSLIRCVVVDAGGELYAMPIGHVEKVVHFSMSDVRTLEGKQYLIIDDREIGLVDGHQILELPSNRKEHGQNMAAVMLGRDRLHYMMTVDRILYETDLVERPLDVRLGKVQDVSAMSFLDDGRPVIILDVDDIIRSIERLIGGAQLSNVSQDGGEESRQSDRKQVLVVDDSLTVRELERNLLTTRGYAVDVAVDGADAWNAVRVKSYDLIVSDVDMPRMDGIELVSKIRADDRLKSLPIIIISYKDREEDRNRGMVAGADHYLTKGSFQDESFVETVEELIGDPVDL